jgi:hypothetical protein
LGILLVTVLSLNSSLVFGKTCKEEFRGKIAWDEKGQIALPGGARADLVENGIMLADDGTLSGVSEAIFSFPEGILSDTSPEFIMHVELSYYDGTYTEENCVVKGDWYCTAELLDSTLEGLESTEADALATALLCRIPPAGQQPLQISFTAISQGNKSWSFIITTLGIISSGSAHKLKGK